MSTDQDRAGRELDHVLRDLLVVVERDDVGLRVAEPTGRVAGRNPLVAAVQQVLTVCVSKVPNRLFTAQGPKASSPPNYLWDIVYEYW